MAFGTDDKPALCYVDPALRKSQNLGLAGRYCDFRGGSPVAYKGSAGGEVRGMWVGFMPL